MYVSGNDLSIGQRILSCSGIPIPLLYRLHSYIVSWLPKQLSTSNHTSSYNSYMHAIKFIFSEVSRLTMLQLITMIRCFKTYYTREVGKCLHVSCLQKAFMFGYRTCHGSEFQKACMHARCLESVIVIRHAATGQRVALPFPMMIVAP